MTAAPKRIWAYDDGAFLMAFDYETTVGGAVPYVLAIPEALEAAPEVQALIEAAVDAERERCATLVEAMEILHGVEDEIRPRSDGNRAGLAYAAAIRAFKKGE